MLGGIRGAWMDDERFVLTDDHQSRLLAYSASEGLVRIVNGWDGEDPELNFLSPSDIERWGDGFVLVDSSSREDFLLELDSELRPVRVLWKSDVVQVDGIWRGEEIDGLDEVTALGDRLYLRAGRLGDSRVALQPLYADFGPDRRPDQAAGVVREQATWLAPASAEMYWHTPIRRLAATHGSTPSVFALRFGEAPFVQQFAPEERRLASFPGLPAPLPTLPVGGGYEGVLAFYSVLEASSYPAGLYGDQDSLFILMRNTTGDETVWDLYRLDPQNDEIVSKVRLPTTAAHVSLLPGRRFWGLEESTSGVEDILPVPIRLLLLSSTAIRSGAVPSCD